MPTHASLSGAELHDPKAHATSHESGGSDALAVDAAAGTGSLRTLGTTSSKAAAGNHTVPAFVGSGGGHAAGHVPDPGASAGTTAYLCEDGTWRVPGGGGGGGTDPDVFLTCTEAGSVGGIAKGTPVYTDAADSPTVHPLIYAQNGGDSVTIGVAAADFATSAVGLVQTAGLLAGIDTSAFAVGDRLWADDSTGALTNVSQTNQNFVGWVVTSHATTGSIIVHIQKRAAFGHSHSAYGDGGPYLVGTELDHPFVNDYLDVVTVGSAPVAPASGKVRLYVKTSDGKLYRKDSSNAETLIG